MLALGSLVFASPWLLAALPALPFLWWLLRVTPPAPRRVTFPAVGLLAGLRARRGRSSAAVRGPAAPRAPRREPAGPRRPAGAPSRAPPCRGGPCPRRSASTANRRATARRSARLPIRARARRRVRTWPTGANRSSMPDRRAGTGGTARTRRRRRPASARERPAPPWPRFVPPRRGAAAGRRPVAPRAGERRRPSCAVPAQARRATSRSTTCGIVVPSARAAKFSAMRWRSVGAARAATSSADGDSLPSSSARALTASISA